MIKLRARQEYTKEQLLKLEEMQKDEILEKYADEKFFEKQENFMKKVLKN